MFTDVVLPGIGRVTVPADPDTSVPVLDSVTIKLDYDAMDAMLYSSDTMDA